MNESVLVVDDDPAVRELLRSQVSFLGYSCRTASGGEEALAMVLAHEKPALVLSDVHMPGFSGLQLLQELKAVDPSIQVIMISGLQDLATVRASIREGAYDYLVKPFELEDLTATVSRALERGRLITQNERYRKNLERMVAEQTREIRQTRDMAFITLAKLAESRHDETGRHLERMAEYSRRLIEELRSGPYATEITSEFVDHLYESSPLHDIGKVGIPDSILMKPAALTPDEVEIMKTHTLIGGNTLRFVIERYEGRTFLSMAMVIAYFHHEQWDGSGYPRGLAGDAIPLPARIVALADAYDAITSDRPYATADTHENAIRRINVSRGRHFDPVLVDAFNSCHEDFDSIHRSLEDRAQDPESTGRTSADAGKILDELPWDNRRMGSTPL